MRFRLPSDDTRKSLAVLKQQHKKGLVCCIAGCNSPICQLNGPGSDVLCRDHQLAQREYGGPGRVDRPHTFHRKWVWVDCGKDVSVAVTEKYPNLEVDNPKLFNRLCRNRIIGDHIIRKADGGLDTEENIQSLCLDCNSDKTILNEDYRR